MKIPRPVTGLEVLTVDQSSRAGLQERSAKDTDVVEAALGGVGVVTELLGTPELSLLAQHTYIVTHLVRRKIFNIFKQYRNTNSVQNSEIVGR